MRINPFYLHGEEFTPVRKLLALHALAGGVPLTEYTATGNPVSFETNVAKPLSECLLSFLPVQSGTGDPSPDNVRPITGWTGANVYLSPTGTDDPDKQTFAVTFPEEAGTVYGGTLDITTGVLTITEVCVSLKNRNWYHYSGNTMFAWNAGKDKNSSIICDSFPVIINNTSQDESIRVYANGAGYAANIYFYKTGLASADEFNAWMNGLEFDPHICYLLQTPQTYQLTPTEIQTIIGTNVLWSDTNGDMEIKYLKKG